MALLVFEVAFGVSYVCNDLPLGMFWFSGVFGLMASLLVGVVV